MNLKTIVFAAVLLAAAPTLQARDLTQLQDIAATPDFKFHSAGGAEYGGIYEFVGVSCNRPNRITGGCSCSQGFSPQQIYYYRDGEDPAIGIPGNPPTASLWACYKL
jgi:hypothetical protein